MAQIGTIVVGVVFHVRLIKYVVMGCVLVLELLNIVLGVLLVELMQHVVVVNVLIIYHNKNVML
jgi:hypothetical protein